MDETDIKVATNGTNATSFGSSLDNKLLAVQSIVGLLILSTNIFIFYVFFNNKSILKKNKIQSFDIKFISTTFPCWFSIFR